jgi:hypothetical protein
LETAATGYNHRGFLGWRGRFAAKLLCLGYAFGDSLCSDQSIGRAFSLQSHRVFIDYPARTFSLCFSLAASPRVAICFNCARIVRAGQIFRCQRF